MTLAFLWSCSPEVACDPCTGTVAAGSGASTDSPLEWSYESGWEPRWLDVIPDVTGDGLSDVLAQLWGGEAMVMLLVPSPLLGARSLPSDAFELVGDLSPVWSGPSAGDVDGDGIADLVLRRSSSAWLFPGPITGPRQLVDGRALKGGDAVHHDVDGDGILDEVEVGETLASVRFGPVPYPAAPDLQVALCLPGTSPPTDRVLSVFDDVTGDGFAELGVAVAPPETCGGVLVSLGPEEDPFASGAWARFDGIQVVVSLPDQDGDGLKDVFRAPTWEQGTRGAGELLSGPVAFEGGEVVAAATVVWSVQEVFVQRLDTGGDLRPDLVVWSDDLVGPDEGGWALVEGFGDIPAEARRWARGEPMAFVEGGRAWILDRDRAIGLGPAKPIR